MSLPPNPHPKEQPGYVPGNQPGNYPYRAPDVPPKQGIPVWGWLLIGCGGMMFMVIPILAAILFPVFAQARQKARQTICLSNEKMLAIGAMMYVEDFDQKFPPAETWQAGIKPYLGKTDTDAEGGKRPSPLHCPNSETVHTSYALNGKLPKDGLEGISAPMSLVLLFESDKDVESAHGGPESLVSKPRHMNSNNFAFADGHCKSISAGTPQNFDPRK